MRCSASHCFLHFNFCLHGSVWFQTADVIEMNFIYIIIKESYRGKKGQLAAEVG